MNCRSPERNEEKDAMEDGPRAGGGLRLRPQDAPSTAGPPRAGALAPDPAAPQQLHRG